MRAKSFMLDALLGCCLLALDANYVVATLLENFQVMEVCSTFCYSFTSRSSLSETYLSLLSSPTARHATPPCFNMYAFTALTM